MDSGWEDEWSGGLVFYFWAFCWNLVAMLAGEGDRSSPPASEVCFGIFLHGWIMWHNIIGSLSQFCDIFVHMQIIGWCGGVV